MRTVFFFIAFIFYMIGSIFKIIKVKFLEKKGLYKEANEYIEKSVYNWGRFILRISGINVQVVGIENLPKGNCLFVSNHQGNFDIPLILASINKSIGFVAKKELKNVPLVSYWMKKIHCTFIDRNNIREAVKSINEGVEYLKEGYSMIIFPEGTRSRSNNMGEFKKGSMKLALKAGVPIVPMTIDGTYKAYEKNSNKVKPTDVKLTIWQPIMIENLSKEEQNNLSLYVSEIIKKGL